jgi:single-strand DNA-binding protein
MASLNKVMLIGNLTRDAELRYIPSGSAVLEFRLAVSRKFKKQDGTEGEETCFVDITLWGKRGEAVSKYLTKGKPLFVEGRLQLDEWDDKETGQKRSKLRVVADNIEFLGGRNDGQGGGAGRYEGEGASQGGAPMAQQGGARTSYGGGAARSGVGSGAPASNGNGSRPYPVNAGRPYPVNAGSSTGAAIGVTEDDIPF